MDQVWFLYTGFFPISRSYLKRDECDKTEREGGNGETAGRLAEMMEMMAGRRKQASPKDDIHIAEPLKWLWGRERPSMGPNHFDRDGWLPALTVHTTTWHGSPWLGSTWTSTEIINHSSRCSGEGES